MVDLGFSPGGVPTPKSAIIFQFFSQKLHEMKEFGPSGGHTSLAPHFRSTNGQCTMEHLGRQNDT